MPPPPVPLVAPIDQSTEAVLVTNTVPGARVSVFVNGVWFAWADAPAASARIALPHHLAPGDTVRASQEHHGLSSGLSGPVTVEHNYVTEHYDNLRTGWNLHEPLLTVGGVHTSFGLLFTHPLDGQAYAQPLYVRNLSIPGKGIHNVVLVATEGDSVYAFDADSNTGISVAPLWQRSLIPAGEAIVTPADVDGCNNVSPHIGITGTPVIDRATSTLYVVAKTKAGATFHLRLHALELTTGADKPGSPVEIQGEVAGTGDISTTQKNTTGRVPFGPQYQMNRPGLLLQNGTLYLGFGAHCDFGPYHGWVLAYDASSLDPVGIFNTSPDINPPTKVFPGRGGGIWQAGIGLAADAQGYVYFLTGNGPFNANTSGRDYGDSAVKLRPDMSVADYFTPHNQDDMNTNDTDLGSGGAMVLPDQPGPHRDLLVGCGKEGTIYLLDRQNMGQFNGPAGPDHVLQSLVHAIGGLWGGPAYYQGPGGQFVFYCGNGDHLKAFGLIGAALTFHAQSTETFHLGGASPVISSNGGAPGTGIVWLISRGSTLTLFAYDASNVASKLFQGDAGPWNNPNGMPFVTPTPIQGKVYVGTGDRLAVFGLLPKHKPEKLEIKEHKLEKFEIKEHKVEKLEAKDQGLEKIHQPKEVLEGGKLQKDSVDVPQPPGPIIQPTPIQHHVQSQGSSGLAHFITAAQRPDLRAGALSQEPDRSEAQPLVAGQP